MARNVRAIDGRGRVELPPAVRQALAIGFVGKVEIDVDDQAPQLRLVAWSPRCELCGNDAGAYELAPDKWVCRECCKDALAALQADDAEE